MCFYLSLGLSGNFGYLFWLAPVPILAISFKTSAGKSFLIAFAAYLVGKLNWFTYLVSVVTLVPAIFFTLLLPLIFAFIVILSRRVVTRSNQWYSVFAFPVFFTSFEFLVLRFSADGSAGSIAYSQSNILPVIQIASVTGMLGITFIITFISSALATAWHFRKEKNKFRNITGCAITIIPVVVLFGITRLFISSEKNKLKVGLAVLDEKLHYITQYPDIEKEKRSAEDYAQLISGLADSGAKLVLLPERAININRETEPAVLNILSSIARQKNIFIITGYTNFKADVHRNSSLVIDTAGKVIVDYNKVYLVPGLEKQFTPGRDIGLFTYNNIKAGTAICKDLDFPSYIKRYGTAAIDFLNIPSWDFVKDDWLHSRMAVLRGVENGFSEVRTARLGRLTISDAYGRINAEANSSDGKAVVLTGNVSIKKLNTIYSQWGDWFGIVNSMAAVFFIFLIVKRQSH
ncbi:MAG: apolipoprotein N-acyltransferase [Chitinophagales bacterium]